MHFYHKDVNNDLVIYHVVKTATDYKDLADKVYTHTEYHTEWANLIYEWKQKGYIEYVTTDTFTGVSDCIFRITFVGGTKPVEFIAELEKYFNGKDCFSLSDNVYTVGYTSIKLMGTK
jgi:hypothetical protein